MTSILDASGTFSSTFFFVSLNLIFVDALALIVTLETSS